MLDIIGMFIIVIFAPIIIMHGMKYYKISLGKSIKVLTYILLGFELFRFFYTAKLYDRAYMPADKVTFTFLTFSVVLALFSCFNKSKVGQFSKSIFTYTSLCPIVMALFYPHVYTNELDVYAVTKALYFAESGIVLTMALMQLKEEINKINYGVLLYTIAFVFVYVFANVMRNVFWIPSMAFDLKWFLCMAVVLVVPCALILVSNLLKKKENKKQ